MNKIENIVDTFYRAFAKRDYITMNSFYHKDAQFSDPVFQNLQGKEIQAMWHMLCDAGKDLHITHSSIGAYDNSARVTWKAVYTFSRTGHIIHNEINAELYFQDSQIINHFDSFSLYRWIRMAFGTTGLLLGWSSTMHEKIRMTARRQLQQFISNNPQYK